MLTTAYQFKMLQQQIKNKDIKKSSHQTVRVISFHKWKNIMLSSVEILKLNLSFDQTLLDDLRVVVEKIPEQFFIEAIMNLQPYKPKFKVSSFRKESSPGKKRQWSSKKREKYFKTQFCGQTQTTDSISKISDLASSRKAKTQFLTIFIEEDHLTKELQSKSHPFTKTIEDLTKLLENKYKTMIEQIVEERGIVEMDEICLELSKDVVMIQSFFKLSSKPIIEIFGGREDSGRVQEEISNFIVHFIRSHPTLFKSLRKIIRFAAKKSREMELFEFNCPLQPMIEKYEIAENLMIEGHYMYTANEMIELSTASTGKECLQKLKQIRSSFYKDIHEFKEREEKEEQSISVSSESQLQIFKYLFSKVRIFANDIFSQLILLEILYGEEEIGYHYGVSSFIHSQLTVALQAIRLNI